LRDTDTPDVEDAAGTVGSGFAQYLWTGTDTALPSRIAKSTVPAYLPMTLTRRSFVDPSEERLLTTKLAPPEYVTFAIAAASAGMLNLGTLFPDPDSLIGANAAAGAVESAGVSVADAVSVAIGVATGVAVAVWVPPGVAAVGVAVAVIPPVLPPAGLLRPPMAPRTRITPTTIAAIPNRRFHHGFFDGAVAPVGLPGGTQPEGGAGSVGVAGAIVAHPAGERSGGCAG
jgi:hypothetical protein